MTKPTYEELQALNENLAQLLVGMSDRLQESALEIASRAWVEGRDAALKAVNQGIRSRERQAKGRSNEFPGLWFEPVRELNLLRIAIRAATPENPYQWMLEAKVLEDPTAAEENPHD
ncbi:hypothetical protein ODZ83_05515 [Acaricomes phytoseiuli]|uniref:hypothetical protein n=1 Tax=Acaricomes phytoseiuli TaxID=291968 RepID=UPI002222105E|nr:hypothetical protein [Acaricomes phytoseiuli]MCW1249649.1 hypothetical protein [Acaricomes phytoseiuli]